MAQPSVAVINFSERSDQRVQDAIRSVNRQISEDFMPLWGTGRELFLQAANFNPAHPDQLSEEPVRADGVLYLVQEATLPGALGYHDMNAAEIPVGFVFMESDDWTITLSHEALELIVDPTVNIFVPGPHPVENRWVWHSYEVCDAVERTAYEIDGIRVSNFVTPAYFREGDAPGTRNDFLGVGVTSFGVTEDSHLGVANADTYEWEVILGRLAPSMEPQVRRAQAFGHKKPARPGEDKLLAILDGYHERPHEGCQGLPHLNGVTRTSRYRKTAKQLHGARKPGAQAQHE